MKQKILLILLLIIALQYNSYAQPDPKDSVITIYLADTNLIVKGATVNGIVQLSSPDPNVQAILRNYTF